MNAHRTAIALLGVMSLVVNPVAAQAQAHAPSSDEKAPALLLILDASGSMKADDGSGRAKVAASKDALNQMVDALPDGAPVGLRVYGHRVSNAAKDKSRGLP